MIIQGIIDPFSLLQELLPQICVIIGSVNDWSGHLPALQRKKPVLEEEENCVEDRGEK